MKKQSLSLVVKLQILTAFTQGAEKSVPVFHPSSDFYLHIKDPVGLVEFAYLLALCFQCPAKTLCLRPPGCQVGGFRCAGCRRRPLAQKNSVARVAANCGSCSLTVKVVKWGWGQVCLFNTWTRRRTCTRNTCCISATWRRPPAPV